MIFIRADANPKIGSGHIMRCLSIGEALQKKGKEICFILADEMSAKILRKRQQAYMLLHTDYADMEGELPALLLLLAQKKPEFILVDSYFVTRGYLEAIGKYTKTVYVDDKKLFSYPVDMVLNYNIYGDEQFYGTVSGKGRGALPAEGFKQPCFLLGTRYAPLREEFCSLPYEIRRRAGSVLITTGGNDKYNLAGKILKEALAGKETGKLRYHVVSGAFNENLSTLQEIAKAHSNVSIHQNVMRMAELMQGCDIAITAGGSTMYELCAVGVPIICFSFVDNQEQIVRSFLKKGLVCFGGDYLAEQEGMIHGAVRALALLLEDYEGRKEYSKKERKLVDGLGAERIAEALCVEFC